MGGVGIGSGVKNLRLINSKFQRGLLGVYFCVGIVTMVFSIIVFQVYY